MKKYIIAIALFCLSLFLIDEVYAATSSYTNANYSYTNCEGTWSCNSTSFISPYTQLGTNVNPTNERIGNISVRAYNTNSYWMMGDNYNFNFRVCEQRKWKNSETLSNVRSRLNLYEFTYNSNDAATGSTSGNTSDVIMTITDDSSSSYCWFMNFNLTPKENLQYVGFRVTAAACNDSTGCGIDVGTWFTVERLNITYNAGVGSIIQESNQQIIQEQQQTNDKLDETNEQLGDLNDNLTNNDTSGATNSAGGFFEGFTTDTFGLTSIITAPLNLIQNITSKTCTPLNLQIPFVNKNMQLPCMSTIYSNYFGSFLTIYQTITFGIISYWVCIRIFALVKDFKNPDHDEIEVMDL